MSHQPYEDWILDPITLSIDERRALQAHLSVCQQCQRLEHRWQAVRHQLRTGSMAAPAPGFTQRWQANLAARQAQQQRRQGWKIFGFLFGGALLILLLLAGYAAATTSPAEWLTAFLRTYTTSQNLVGLVEYAVQSWVTGTPTALKFALWLYSGVILLGLVMTWGLVLWRTKTAGAMES